MESRFAHSSMVSWVPARAVTAVCIASLLLLAAKPIEAQVVNEQAKLTASDATVLDEFGVAVAVEGGTAVIGAWKDDDNGASSGSAYVFERDSLTGV